MYCKMEVLMSSEGGGAIFGVISWQESGNGNVDKVEGMTQEDINDCPHALMFGTYGN